MNCVNCSYSINDDFFCCALEQRARDLLTRKSLTRHHHFLSLAGGGGERAEAAVAGASRRRRRRHRSIHVSTAFAAPFYPLLSNNGNSPHPQKKIDSLSLSLTLNTAFSVSLLREKKIAVNRDFFVCVYFFNCFQLICRKIK